MEMKQIKITNWKQYGEMSVFTGIIDEYSLDVVTEDYRDNIYATGSPGHIHVFCEALKKKEIPFEPLNHLTMY